MRKTGFRLLAVCLTLILCLGTASAAVRGSDYFAAYAVFATALSGGKVTFEADMDATRTMGILGMSRIVVEEKQTDGTWKNVETTYAADDSSMYETNVPTSLVSYSYYGTVGKSYRAAITLYASDAKGSDSRLQITSAVTAKK